MSILFVKCLWIDDKSQKKMNLPGLKIWLHLSQREANC